MTRNDKTTAKGRLKLPDALAADLLDFRAANYMAQEQEVVREALREHIDRRLREPAMKQRFDEARAKRLATVGTNVTVLRSGK